MTIEFAQIVSSIDQRPGTTEPVPVFMDQNDQMAGLEHSMEHPADIRILESGVYVIIAAPQVGRTSGSEPANVDFWLRKNGQDVPNSNVRCRLTGNDSKDVVVNQTMSSFRRGDIINLMMAIERTGEGIGIEAIITKGRPLIPSIIFSIHKIQNSVDGHWRSSEKGTKKVWVETT